MRDQVAFPWEKGLFCDGNREFYGVRLYFMKVQIRKVGLLSERAVTFCDCKISLIIFKMTNCAVLYYLFLIMQELQRNQLQVCTNDYMVGSVKNA